MAGFRKAEPKQAAIKMSIYGPPGSGKTFTALLCAEGLARHSGKRVAFVDTERGTDFYAKAVPDRPTHSEAFEFDALYTRSLTEVLSEVRKLKAADYGVIVIDSVTHLWEAAKAAYTGKQNKAGQIPMHAWSGIKKPYKDLMNYLINSPFHVLILGRQGTEFGEDEDGEVKAVGTKMKAEGETAYEPHVCLRMEESRRRQGKRGPMVKVPTAFAEKDRSGVLQGKIIEWPCFENLMMPLLGLLGDTQAQIQSEDEAAQADAEALEKAERQKVADSRRLRDTFEAKFKLCANATDVAAVSAEVTAEMKRQMAAADVAALREAFLEADRRVKANPEPSETPS